MSRTLTLEIAPEASALAPGSETAIDLTATDATGQPVENAELAVVIVDEAVLALTGYQIANPLAVFYADAAWVRDGKRLLTQQHCAGRPGDARQPVWPLAWAVVGIWLPKQRWRRQPRQCQRWRWTASSWKGAGESSEENQPASGAITVRSDFNPLAIFAPAVRTDAEGKARIEFKLPDNLTPYRVTVVAATEKQFGQSEANITARLPLMVRPSAPRFLNFGDRFEMPIVVQNQTEQAMDVQVALQVSNLILDNGQPEQDAQAGQSITVPANDRVELRFPASDRKRRHGALPGGSGQR